MSDPDSVQIKAALLDQIKEYEGCFEWPVNELQSNGGGHLPDVPGAGIVGTGDQYDFAGYDGSDDYAESDGVCMYYFDAD